MRVLALRNIQRILPAAVALLALAILNGTAWWSYRMSSDQIRTNFSRNLVSTAKTFAHQIEESYWSEIERGSLDLEFAPPGESSSGGESAFLSMEEWLAVAGGDRLHRLSPESSGSESFQDLYLLDKNGGLVASLSGILDPNSAPPTHAGDWNVHPAFSEEERTEVMGAYLTGRDRISAEVFQGGFYYQTAFAPISLEDSPRGLLGIRANLLFGDRLTTIRNGILAASSIGSLLVVLLTLMFYRVWEALRKTEDRLIHQERLAQLGSMVASVAHEIRNPLGIIEQTGELIRRRYARGENDDLLDYIPQEVDRLNRIVSRFLEFARREGMSDSGAECRLQDEIERIHRQLLPEAVERNIEFLHRSDDSVPAVSGLRPDAARQMLLNLVLNAFDASEPGGRVSILLRKGNVGVELEVSDEGCGMSPETISRAREPFFTTKEKGSGLGLSLVNKLAEESGGVLRIESEPGTGTSIVIAFDTRF